MVVQDHKDILQASRKTSILPVSDVQQEDYRHNFYGLIKALRLPLMFKQCYLVVNDLVEPTQEFSQASVIIPDEQEMMDLYKNS